MTFISYIKDRVIPLLIMAVTIIFVVLMLWAISYSLLVVVVISVVLVGALFAASLWDFLVRRRFYAELEEALRSDNESLYLTAFLNDPGFREGHLTYRAIEEATKDMNDCIASYRLASEEYRDYVETWIHEIKTPIASSRLTLSNNTGNPLVLPLECDFDRIEAYLDQALYYSRSTAVERDYFIKELELDFLIKAAIKKNSRALIDAGLRPHFENLAVCVYSDAKWLEFILDQIIANAIKYRRPKSFGNSPSLVFRARTCEECFESKSVILDITDNGVGISETDVDRVFEKGFTGENGRSFARSTGIGLYLCNKLCEKMKLRMSICSVKGEYTTVSIEFPLSKIYFLS